MTAREAIIQIIEETVRKPIYMGKVLPGSVSGGLCTVVDLDDETHQFLAVRLQANPGNGQLFTPADNSIVLIVENQKFDYAIIMYSAVTAIKWLDGSAGGLVKVIQLTQKLNNLENLVNDLINKFNTHVHTGVTTGPGSSGTTPSVESSTLTPTVRGDIENANITHGNP